MFQADDRQIGRNPVYAAVRGNGGEHAAAS
jgi:hypothetical protein